MEAVATRAGVSKATLYRRFPSKRELIAAALRTIRSTRPVPDTGSFRGDLREMVRREVARAKRVPHIGRLSARLLGDVADEPDMLALLRETVMAIDYAMLGEIVRRGIARGELRPDLDVSLASELLHATLVFRFLTSGGRRDPLSDRNSTRLIDTLLVGLAHRIRPSVRRRGHRGATG
jgi:AcrR family transcriptional regulator